MRGSGDRYGRRGSGERGEVRVRGVERGGEG